MPAQLKVRIIEARNLPVMDRTSGLTDAYVQVRFCNTLVLETPCIRKTLSPVWNADCRIEIPDDAMFQEEALEFKIWDKDYVSSDDVIGTVLVDLNTLLSLEEESWQLLGWFPIYDSRRGFRGELKLSIKLDSFTERSSPTSVAFSTSRSVPPCWNLLEVIGFVEELLAAEDPEYEWGGSFRAARTSNDARQLVLQRLSGELRRRIGMAATAVGSNAVLGFVQHFDFEEHSGLIIARAMGTACKISIAKNTADREPAHEPAVHSARQSAVYPGSFYLQHQHPQSSPATTPPSIPRCPPQSERAGPTPVATAGAALGSELQPQRDYSLDEESPLSVTSSSTSTSSPSSASSTSSSPSSSDSSSDEGTRDDGGPKLALSESTDSDSSSSDASASSRSTTRAATAGGVAGATTAATDDASDSDTSSGDDSSASSSSSTSSSRSMASSALSSSSSSTSTSTAGAANKSSSDDVTSSSSGGSDDDVATVSTTTRRHRRHKNLASASTLSSPTTAAALPVLMPQPPAGYPVCRGSSSLPPLRQTLSTGSAPVVPVVPPLALDSTLASEPTPPPLLPEPPPAMAGQREVNDEHRSLLAALLPTTATGPEGAAAATRPASPPSRPASPSSTSSSDSSLCILGGQINKLAWPERGSKCRASDTRRQHEGESALLAEEMAMRDYDAGPLLRIDNHLRDVLLATMTCSPHPAAVGGYVAARAVKVLTKGQTPAVDAGIRSEWWAQVREEIRSHARRLCCNAVIAYSEQSTVCGEVCVLSASGTAVAFDVTTINADVLRLRNEGQELAAAAQATAAEGAASARQLRAQLGAAQRSLKHWFATEQHLHRRQARDAHKKQQHHPPKSGHGGPDGEGTPPDGTGVSALFIAVPPAAPAQAGCHIDNRDDAAPPCSGTATTGVPEAASSAGVCSPLAEPTASPPPIPPGRPLGSPAAANATKPSESRDNETDSKRHHHGQGPASGTASDSVRHECHWIYHAFHASQRQAAVQSSSDSATATPPPTCAAALQRFCEGILENAATVTRAAMLAASPIPGGRPHIPTCASVHAPYRPSLAPFPVRLMRCACCRRAAVPEMITETQLPWRTVNARACRSFRSGMSGEATATMLSDMLPFVEVDLHRQLIAKARLLGRNAIFNLDVQLTLGPSHLIAIATGTALFLNALPPPPPLRINRTIGIRDDEDRVCAAGPTGPVWLYPHLPRAHEDERAPCLALLSATNQDMRLVELQRRLENTAARSRQLLCPVQPLAARVPAPMLSSVVGRRLAADPVVQCALTTASCSCCALCRAAQPPPPPQQQQQQASQPELAKQLQQQSDSPAGDSEPQGCAKAKEDGAVEDEEKRPLGSAATTTTAGETDRDNPAVQSRDADDQSATTTQAKPSGKHTSVPPSPAASTHSRRTHRTRQSRSTERDGDGEGDGGGDGDDDERSHSHHTASRLSHRGARRGAPAPSSSNEEGSLHSPPLTAHQSARHAPQSPGARSDSAEAHSSTSGEGRVLLRTHSSRRKARRHSKSQSRSRSRSHGHSPNRSPSRSNDTRSHNHRRTPPLTDDEDDAMERTRGPAGVRKATLDTSARGSALRHSPPAGSPADSDAGDGGCVASGEGAGSSAMPSAADSTTPEAGRRAHAATGGEARMQHSDEDDDEGFDEEDEEVGDEEDEGEGDLDEEAAGEPPKKASPSTPPQQLPALRATAVSDIAHGETTLQRGMRRESGQKGRAGASVAAAMLSPGASATSASAMEPSDTGSEAPEGTRRTTEGDVTASTSKRMGGSAPWCVEDELADAGVVALQDETPMEADQRAEDEQTERAVDAHLRARRRASEQRKRAPQQQGLVEYEFSDLENLPDEQTEGTFVIEVDDEEDEDTLALLLDQAPPAGIAVLSSALPAPLSRPILCPVQLPLPPSTDQPCPTAPTSAPAAPATPTAPATGEAAREVGEQTEDALDGGCSAGSKSRGTHASPTATRPPLAPPSSAPCSPVQKASLPQTPVPSSAAPSVSPSGLGTTIARLTLPPSNAMGTIFGTLATGTAVTPVPDTSPLPPAELTAQWLTHLPAPVATRLTAAAHDAVALQEALEQLPDLSAVPHPPWSATEATSAAMVHTSATAPSGAGPSTVPTGATQLLLVDGLLITAPAAGPSASAPPWASSSVVSSAAAPTPAGNRLAEATAALALCTSTPLQPLPMLVAIQMSPVPGLLPAMATAVLATPSAATTAVTASWSPTGAAPGGGASGAAGGAQSTPAPGASQSGTAIATQKLRSSLAATMQSLLDAALFRYRKMAPCVVSSLRWSIYLPSPGVMQLVLTACASRPELPTPAGNGAVLPPALSVETDAPSFFTGVAGDSTTLVTGRSASAAALTGPPPAPSVRALLSTWGSLQWYAHFLGLPASLARLAAQTHDALRAMRRPAVPPPPGQSKQAVATRAPLAVASVPVRGGGTASTPAPSDALSTAQATMNSAPSQVTVAASKTGGGVNELTGDGDDGADDRELELLATTAGATPPTLAASSSAPATASVPAGSPQRVSSAADLARLVHRPSQPHHHHHHRHRHRHHQAGIHIVSSSAQLSPAAATANSGQQPSTASPPPAGAIVAETHSPSAERTLSSAAKHHHHHRGHHRHPTSSHPGEDAAAAAAPTTAQQAIAPLAPSAAPPSSESCTPAPAPPNQAAHGARRHGDHRRHHRHRHHTHRHHGRAHHAQRPLPTIGARTTPPPLGNSPTGRAAAVSMPAPATTPSEGPGPSDDSVFFVLAPATDTRAQTAFADGGSATPAASILEGSFAMAASPRSPTTLAIPPMSDALSLPQQQQAGWTAGDSAQPTVRPEEVIITPEATVPGREVRRGFGPLLLNVIREGWSLREGEDALFIHLVLSEALALARAHVAALGANALLSFRLVECRCTLNPHKTQMYCLVVISGDIAIAAPPAPPLAANTVLVSHATSMSSVAQGSASSQHHATRAAMPASNGLVEPLGLLLRVQHTLAALAAAYSHHVHHHEHATALPCAAGGAGTGADSSRASAAPISAAARQARRLHHRRRYARTHLHMRRRHTPAPDGEDGAWPARHTSVHRHVHIRRRAPSPLRTHRHMHVPRLRHHQRRADETADKLPSEDFHRHRRRHQQRVAGALPSGGATGGSPKRMSPQSARPPLSPRRESDGEEEAARAEPATTLTGSPQQRHRGTFSAGGAGASAAGAPTPPAPPPRRHRSHSHRVQRRTHLRYHESSPPPSGRHADHTSPHRHSHRHHTHGTPARHRYSPSYHRRHHHRDSPSNHDPVEPFPASPQMVAPGAGMAVPPPAAAPPLSGKPPSGQPQQPRSSAPPSGATPGTSAERHDGRDSALSRRSASGMHLALRGGSSAEVPDGYSHHRHRHYRGGGDMSSHTPHSHGHTAQHAVDSASDEQKDKAGTSGSSRRRYHRRGGSGDLGGSSHRRHDESEGEGEGGSSGGRHDERRNRRIAADDGRSSSDSHLESRRRTWEEDGGRPPDDFLLQ